MGLLDSLTDDPTMSFAMGLLNASGPSARPVSLGHGIAQGYGAMSEAKKNQQAAQMNALQLKHLQSQMEQAALMNPLQLKQLEGQLALQQAQANVPNDFASMLEGLRGGKPQMYQDQVAPQAVGAKEAPKAEMIGGSPEDYFKMVGAIPDTNATEKRAAYEAGFRQWPQFRPQVGSSATNRDPATTIGAYGAMLDARGLKGGDGIIKFAQMLNPTELKGGSTYENRLTGQREFIPQMKEGQMPDGQGGMKEVPGFFNFTKAQKQAEIDPIAAKRLQYETGMSVDGNAPTTTGLPPKDQAAIKEQAFKGGNEDWLKNSYRVTLDSGKSADNILTATQSLRNIDLKTGWGTETKANAASILAGLGIAPKNAEMFAANAQQFQSQAATRLWEVLNNAKGPQTDQDATRAKDTFASLKNTPQANEFILDLAEATARRDKLKAQFYAEAMPVARDSGDLTAVDRKWSQIQRSIWDDPLMAKWKKK